VLLGASYLNFSNRVDVMGSDKYWFD
jgi:hypothetical protein